MSMTYFPSELSEPEALLARMSALRQQVYTDGCALFARWRPQIHRRVFLAGALNLAYYIALRRQDIRPLQRALRPWGLSSLGRSEGRVLQNLDAVLATLSVLCGREPATLPPRPTLRSFLRGERLLQRAAEELLGPSVPHRRVQIMVTLDRTAADNPSFVHELIQRGMDCARINCAHDDVETWAVMVGHVRAAAKETGRACTVYMDLAGPKVRTGSVITPKPKSRLQRDDLILLTREEGRSAVALPFQASCTEPKVFEHLAVGHSVWFDDGHIGCRVEELRPEGAILRVFAVRAKGERLKADKGINFPNTLLALNRLTKKDLRDLDFAAMHADIVGYSFVEQAADIALLQQEIQARVAGKKRPPGIVAKIETPVAVTNLPDLIVQAAGQQPFGVMIARGDLAVELGYQRLAEMQEEILWLCEAAHAPVIWATQVLENLTKHGIPSRAEITDAAMAERAECVMLNKGPYVAEAVTILDDVLTRMQGHQLKKTPTLRALRSW